MTISFQHGTRVESARGPLWDAQAATPKKVEIKSIMHDNARYTLIHINTRYIRHHSSTMQQNIRVSRILPHHFSKKSHLHRISSFHHQVLPCGREFVDTKGSHQTRRGPFLQCETLQGVEATVVQGDQNALRADERIQKKSFKGFKLMQFIDPTWPNQNRSQNQCLLFQV